MIVPDYGRTTLSDVVPAVAHRLGVPGFDDVLGLPEADRYVVYLVDGLGSEVTAGLGRDAPLLSSLTTTGIGLTAGVPSTTANSITSLATGLPPGQHGIVGYTFRPEVGAEPMNALSWAGGPSDVERFQPNDTIWQHCQRAGVATSAVALNQHRTSGLTRAALRGADYIGLSARASDEAVVAAVVAAAQQGTRSLVYAYERRLDHAGHGHGVASYEWVETASRIDIMLAELRSAVGPSVCVLVTGDHGMVDVPGPTRLTIEDFDELTTGVDMIAGEARFRHLYTNTPHEVAQRWAAELGDRALVRTREQAIEDGWFGPVSEFVVDRLGDVVVAATGTWAFLSTQRLQEYGLVGMHGSLTAAEMRVPLASITDLGWGASAHR